MATHHLMLYILGASACRSADRIGLRSTQWPAGRARKKGSQEGVSPSRFKPLSPGYGYLVRTD